MLHTLWVREHNRLAREYRNENPFENDETIYEHSRRMLIAQWQHVTYTEYLPSILGGTEHIPPYRGYNSSVDASVSKEFSTTAFRYGFFRTMLNLKNTQASLVESQALVKIFCLDPNFPSLI